nr:MAG TPA: hypothetical protein [Bacteriophage sp.]
MFMTILSLVCWNLVIILVTVIIISTSFLYQLVLLYFL